MLSGWAFLAGNAPPVPVGVEPLRPPCIDLYRAAPWLDAADRTCYRAPTRKSTIPSSEVVMSDTIPMNRRDFERALGELKREHDNRDDNPGSHGCEGCQRCYHCMFTTDSQDCFSCNYCHGCSRCSGCTQCRDCSHCHNCSYCVQSEHCSDSSYLILSENCSDCVFCFGCVGLVEKEFHILNEPFSRDEYFKRVAELKESFRIE